MSTGDNHQKDIKIPLTPAVFYILLALHTKERHGYDIMKQVRIDSNDTIKMGPGTLYGSLKRMLEDAYIEELVDPDDSTDERRRYYRLTDIGRQALALEVQRLETVMEIVKRNNLVPGAILIPLKYS